MADRSLHAIFKRLYWPWPPFVSTSSVDNKRRETDFHMIRITSRGRRRHKCTSRDLPVGTVRTASAALGFAHFERVDATSGCFVSKYAQFTAILTERPSTGPARFNGGDTRMLQERTRALYLFRPDDQIEGVWRTHNSYDVLLFQPGYVERFLDEELGARTQRVEPLLRAEPTPVVLWLWRRLAAIHSDISDTARMELDLLGHMMIALMTGMHDLKELPPSLAETHNIASAMRHIHDNLGSALSIAALADIAGLSRFHFCRVFKRATGLPVHGYVIEQRLAHARAMLEGTKQPISQIALEAGFASQSHLNAAFKRRFNTTPRAWRALRRS